MNEIDHDANAKEKLIEARKLIEKPENWGKGDSIMHNEAGQVSYCAIGALEKATTGLPWSGGFFTAHEALRKALPRRRLFWEWDNIVEFNDHPRTKHQDILKLYDRAIASL